MNMQILVCLRELFERSAMLELRRKLIMEATISGEVLRILLILRRIVIGKYIHTEQVMILLQNIILGLNGVK